MMKELEINDTPYGLRVMATDHPANKSVGSCPKDISTKKLNELVALHESIWMGPNLLLPGFEFRVTITIFLRFS